MSCRQTAMLAMTLLMFVVTGSALGSDLIMKKAVKHLDDAIPTVLSSQKVLKPRTSLMASPGTIIDTTYYDWQRNGGLDDHLEVFDDNGTIKINGTMMTAYMVDTSDRAMTYYHYNGSSWTGQGATVFPDRNGFGSMSQFSDGRVAISTHTTLGGGANRASTAYDASVGGYSFSTSGSSETTVLIWPRISVNSNGSISMTGSDQANNDVWVVTGTEGGGFGEWDLNLRDLAPDWMDLDMEWPVIHSGTNGNVGIVIPDVTGPIRLFSSTDNGGSWAVSTIASADTAGLPTGLDSTAARLGWINADIMYIGDEPHVAWTAAQGASDGIGGYGLFDFKSTIYHWSPSTGIDEVVVAKTQSADGARSDFVPTPFNHMSVDWPSMGVAVDGETIVMVFTTFSTDDIDSSGTPTGFVDIMMSVSPDNGETWSPPIPVTNPDGTVLGWDDRYPSLARTNIDNDADPGKDVYLIYQSDNLAGTSVQGTESSQNLDYIKFLGIDIGMVLYYPEPYISGQVNDFTVTGANPGDVVFFVWGIAPGSTPVPTCSGETVDITAPNIAGTAVADVNGVATFSSVIPPPASNFTIRIQAVDLAACLVSNLLEAKFE